MTVLVKLEALEALQAAIAAAIPALADKIVVDQAVSSKIETYPNLSISIVGRMQFDPFDKALQQDLGGGVVVWNVGEHEGPLQMRVVATNKRDRALLEQQLIDLAMSRSGSAGVIVVPVTSNSAIEWVASFEYEDSQWMNQRAFEREYEAVLTFNAVLPMLVVESSVQTIDKLVLGLTSNLSKAYTPDTFGPPDVELVVVNQDGTLSPAT